MKLRKLNNMICTAILLLVVFFSQLYFSQLHAQTENKPNVIFIYADDLGYGDVNGLQK